MRIGFWGNTNNYPFMLAQALRRAGHEVQFVVDSSERLHRPEHRYEEIGYPYPGWIRDEAGCMTRYARYFFPTRRVRLAMRWLGQCDALIVNNFGVLIAQKMGRPYIVLLTGSDLEVSSNATAFLAASESSDLNGDYLKRILRRPLVRRVASRMQAGIRGSLAYSYFAKGLVPSGDAQLDRILAIPEGPSPQRLFLLMSDLDDLEYAPPPLNADLTVFCGARLTWRKPCRPGTTELDHKGTDVLLHGVKRFLATSTVRLHLHLVRKGLDVKETEQLASDLGLGNRVTWHDEMSQRRLFEFFRNADVIVDHLAESVVGMVGLDAMAMGRPLLANGRPEILEPLIAEKSPICQARTADEVCAQLHHLTSPDTRREVGIKSRAYVLKYFSGRSAAERCLEVFARAGIC